jgi:predicted MFS family arabinose efflux permease
MLAASVAAIAAFVVVERSASNPLLPLRVILEPRRAGAYLASFFVGIAMLGTFLFLTYFLQAIQRYSALKTGFAFLPLSGGIIVGAALASQLLPRLGARRLMLGGLALATAGLFMFSHLGVTSSFAAGVLPAELVMSFGLAMTFVPMSSTALSGISPRDAGIASALNNATQQVGGSLGIALLNPVAASAAASYLATHARGLAGPAAERLMPVAAVAGYVRGFQVSTVMLVVAFVLTALLVRPRVNEAPSLEVVASMAHDAPEAA